MVKNEDLCQKCRCANVCIWYNEVNKAIKPFGDNGTMKIKAIITKCPFIQKEK